MKLKISNKV